MTCQYAVMQAMQEPHAELQHRHTGAQQCLNKCKKQPGAVLNCTHADEKQGVGRAHILSSHPVFSTHIL
jgi:hypothetical protein